MNVPFDPGRKLIRRRPVDSAALRSVGYAERQALLQAEVHDGSVYDYLDVPREEYDALMRAESKGSYYSRVFKPKGYRCFKIREGKALLY